MTPKTKDPVAEARALVDERRARLEELRTEIDELDGVEVEAGRAVAVAIAEGGPDIAESLTSTRREFRERLGALHEALPVAEALVQEAEKELQDALASEARQGYAQARHEEQVAVEEAERALTAAADALTKLHAAGRRAYELGNRAGIETATHYRRRLGARDAWLGTLLADVAPEMRTKNRDRVTDLTSRLRSLLPACVETDNAD